MRSLLVRQLADRRASIMGWTFGWLTLIGMYVATWPTVRSHGVQYDQILRDLPAPLRSAIGGTTGGAFSTPAGYFTAELLAVTGSILALTMGVLVGSAAVSRQEEEGTLEVLLSQPMSRTQVLLARTSEAALELSGVLVIAGVALYALGFFVDLRLGVVACLRATTMLTLLALEGMTLGLLAGALTGRPARSRALAGAAGLVVFLLSALGPSISWLASLVVISPFHTLIASDPFRDVPSLGSVATLLLPSLLFTALAVLAFRRRDLRFR